MTARASGAADPQVRSRDLRIQPVHGRRDLDHFIRLPARLYSGAKGFVAPLVIERRDALRQDKNPYFRHGTAQYWLAWRGERPVGRISAQIDQLYLQRHGAGTGHFGFLDAENDSEIFQQLLTTAERWLAERGMRRMLGPLNLSSNEEFGLLVDGFDAAPMLMMPFAPPYAAQHLDALGFRKTKDLVAYDLVIPDPSPEPVQRRIVKLQSSSRIRLRPLDMSRYDSELMTVIDIFNDAWSENWGFVPFTEPEMRHAAKSMRPLIRPDLVWIGEVDGEAAGMIVCLPNLNEAIAGLNGEILPFGWMKVLWRLKVAGLKTGRVLLMGLRKRHQKSAIGTVLVYALLERLRVSMLRAGLRRIELSWVLEDNLPMRRVIEDVGAHVYKTYRIFEKEIR
jgi:GNAT superfamily N-acetyltransferase